jgi:transcription elongation factor Elf1
VEATKAKANDYFFNCPLCGGKSNRGWEIIMGRKHTYICQKCHDDLTDKADELDVDAFNKYFENKVEILNARTQITLPD